MLIFLFIFNFVYADADCPQRYDTENGKAFYIDGAKKELLPRANVETFSPLPPVKSCSENVYARDKYFAYLNGKLIEGADVKGFFVETVDDRYTHDEKHAFWKGKEITQATGQGFRAVAMGYARDAKRVFYQNLEVPEADPRHLVSAGNGFVRDEARVFYQTESYPLSELHLFGSYARLGQKIFYRQTLIPGAEAPNFIAFDDCFGADGDSAFVRASRWTEVKPTELAALEPNSPYRVGCRNQDAEICCALKKDHLIAVVRDKKGATRTIDVPLIEAQSLPGGILKTKTWTFKNLIEQ